MSGSHLSGYQSPLFEGHQTRAGNIISFQAPPSPVLPAFPRLRGQGRTGKGHYVTAVLAARFNGASSGSALSARILLNRTTPGGVRNRIFQKSWSSWTVSGLGTVSIRFPYEILRFLASSMSEMVGKVPKSAYFWSPGRKVKVVQHIPVQPSPPTRPPLLHWKH